MTPSLPAAPPRPIGQMFEPVITAEQGFPALERLVAEAQSSIWMAFRVFDPQTRLRSAAHEGQTWLDLLRDKVSEGVDLRVMLSDFDPLGGPDLHEETWASAYRIDALSAHGSVQVLPVRHEARMGRGMRFGLWVPTLKEIERQRRQMNALGREDRQRRFSHRPGLWRYLREDRAGQIRWRLAPLPRLFPATLHHKLCVVDGEKAMIGGLDVDERRYDDVAHQRAAAETWQDVSVVLDGPAVGDIARHIADVWNMNRLRMAALRREQQRKAPAGAKRLPSAADPLDMPEMPETGGEGGALQVLRTLSVNRRHRLFRVSPQSLVTEIEAAHLAAIKAARTMIYIETQFFRSQVIADALAEAARRNPELELVMILPAAPEEVAFEKRTGLGERKGEALQSHCIKAVRQAYRDRAAILSPVRPVASASPGRDALADAEIIYVHSKVAIFDGQTAIVGSANLNGRSLRWDTEAAIRCCEPTHVGRLWQALINHWMSGPRPGAQAMTAARWTDLAANNAARAPEQRQGFLVPYDDDPAARVGLDVPGIPDELV